MELAVLEMRVGPSDSGCRLRVQTTLCCAGPMTRVVNESAKGETRSRQVRAGQTNASEPLITCRNAQGVIKTSLAEVGWEECGGSLPTARTVTGIEAA